MDGGDLTMAPCFDAARARLVALIGKDGAQKDCSILEGKNENGQPAAPPRKDRGGPRICSGHSGVEDLPGGNMGPPADLSVVARLRRRFGLGDDPKKRMLLYQRLQLLADRHGEAVLVLISEAAAGAVGKNSEGRWFSKAVTAKLAEAGITMKGGANHAAW